MLFQRNKNNWKMEIKVLKKRKKERKYSRNKEGEMSSPTGILRMFSGKVSFCTLWSKKGSIAVETVLVLPVFFLGIVTMVSFMDIYKIQTEHLMELCESVKTAGMYAYVLEGDGPEEVTFPDVYAYEPIGGLISLPKVWFYNMITVHAWTGRSYQKEQEPKEETKKEEMVYVTETGNVYHKDLGCSYLNLSVTSVSGSSVKYLKNDYGNHYGACTSCSSGQNPAAIVYVTEKGDSYHNLETCSSLKRTVRMVKHSSTGEMTACSRCGE